MGRIAAWVGWIPVSLVLTPVWLDGFKYEGYSPEIGDLRVTATVIAAVAGLILGFVHSTRASLKLVLAVMAGVSVGHLVADDLVYRSVIPIDDLHGGPSPVLLALIPVVAAGLGFGVGKLARREPRSAVPGRRWYAVAVVAGLAGISGVADFVSVGAEWATARFHPAATTDAPSPELPAGRHAVFATYNDQPPSCTITVDGADVPISQPTVEFTDNSDSIVTVLYGVFDLPAGGPADVDCPRGRIGDPPEIRGPLGELIFAPAALLWLLGALPGALIAVSVWVKTRKHPMSV
ncbi:hypothetical protein [Actinoplanes sp. NBRC 103695]|uniref:hypothetical protein n=1 Tax=Actinoplanes sp. NBRC 103695 TaxID=3032202 RepID=UPI0024A3DB3D|nr:hypothetical protein [Actinoplanes sp. NBRC 103695]GLY95305.1 hypothetical protein Acsp02_25600 [Actinoplanes sp. NBRC 103695]